MVIEFDPREFAQSGIINLVEPIVIDGSPPPIRIDGTKTKRGLIIDATACTDAGFMLGGKAQLTFVGMHLRGGGQRVLLAKEQSRVQLEQVTISDGTMPGVALFGEAKATLTGCKLLSNRTHGIELHGQAEGTLTRCEFGQNGQSGIAGFDKAMINASQCRVDANGEWGVVLTDDARAQLMGCTLRKARFANVDVSSNASLTIGDTEILDSQRFGLFATGQTVTQLSKVRIAGSGSRGLEAQDRAKVTLMTCRVESNADYGAIFFGQTRVAASECTFSANAAHGVSLRGTAAGQFTKCAFMSNRFSGLGCLDGGDGGAVSASQCTFQNNGMRPIYRGPLHIDPLAPTPVRIDGTRVTCIADPNATIEIYIDRVGEAARYIGETRADATGSFTVETRLIPDGYAVTACATSAGATSEFNVVAASPAPALMHAILGRTGPLSDEGGDQNLDSLVRRWKPGTHIIFQLDKAPSVAVEKYVRFLMQRIPEWTRGCVSAELVMGPLPAATRDAIVIPVRYVAPDAPQLASRGGVTYMSWDNSGFFVPPMEIILALSRETQDTCPRVLAHEIGHALGLCHVRAGLLSRMQGSAAPGAGYVNDFSPMMTYYDVLALQALHDPRNTAEITLKTLVDRGSIPALPVTQMAAARAGVPEPTFSPRPADPPASAAPSRKETP